MNCTNCGNKLEEGVKFCGKCGTPVKVESAPKKEKFLSVSGESVFGIRWIKTPRAKIITGLIMFALAAVCFFDPDLKDMGTLIVILLVGGAWYIYKGIKGRNNSIETKTSTKMSKRSMIILIVAIIVGVGILVWAASNTEPQNTNNSVSSGQTNDSWVVYNAPESNFSAKFPSRPMHDTKTQDTANGTVKIDTYKQADDTASVLYAVNVTELPPSTDLSDPSGFLENTVSLTAGNGTVVTSEKTTNGGYPAISYFVEIVHPTTVSRIKGLNILVGQRLYQVFAAYEKTEENILELEKFTGSFQIK